MSDTLALWSPTLAAAMSVVDFGTVMAGSSGDLSFRVKNLSSTYTAVAVVVSFTGTDGEQFYLSADQRRFTGTYALGNLPPSAVSRRLFVRRVTPSGADIGSYTCNLRLQAQSWK